MSFALPTLSVLHAAPTPPRATPAPSPLGAPPPHPPSPHRTLHTPSPHPPPHPRLTPHRTHASPPHCTHASPPTVPTPHPPTAPAPHPPRHRHRRLPMNCRLRWSTWLSTRRSMWCSWGMTGSSTSGGCSSWGCGRECGWVSVCVWVGVGAGSLGVSWCSRGATGSSASGGCAAAGVVCAGNLRVPVLLVRTRLLPRRLLPPCSAMARPGTPGDELALRAVGDHFGCSINVVTPGG